MDLKRVRFGISQRIVSGFYCLGGDYGKVFMFHQVNNDRREWIDDNFSITQDGFEEFIKLIRKKYTITGIDDILFCVDKVKAADKARRRVCLTFDDIYEDVFYYALPILEKNSIPFTVFISTDFIDKKGFVSSTMLNSFRDNPLCTIGAHGITHSMVRYLPKDDARREIEGSKICLEEKTHTKIKYYAFPYGSLYACSRRDRRIALESGFEACFSTINSPINKLSFCDRSFLPRINVNQNNYKRLV